MRKFSVGQIAGRATSPLYDVNKIPQNVKTTNSTVTANRQASSNAPSLSHPKESGTTSKEVVGEERAVGTSTVTLRQLAIAVATAEGWNTKGSLARRNLNQCNIRKSCTAGKSGGFGKCKTEEDGWKLCEATLKFYISRGKTLQQMINYFSPVSDGNNPIRHADTIAKLAGIDKTIPLNQLIK